METDRGIKDEIKEIREILSKDKEETKKQKVKKFIIPRKGRINRARAKKNWVTVLELYENRTAKFNRYKIDEQTIMIDDVPRLATADNIFLIEGRQKKPLVVLPTWSVKPTSPSDKDFFSISENYKETENKGLTKTGYKVLFNRMKTEAMSTKKPVPWWLWLVGLGIIGVVIYLVMFQK